MKKGRKRRGNSVARSSGSESSLEGQTKQRKEPSSSSSDSLSQRLPAVQSGSSAPGATPPSTTNPIARVIPDELVPDANVPVSAFTSKNPFGVLNPNVEVPDRSPRPPPIYISDVKDFSSLVISLTSLLGQNNFICKARLSDVAVHTHDSESYRKVVRHLKALNIQHHTYQLKEEKTYRVVIRHLHPSTPCDEIKSELDKLGSKTRNVTNILQPVTKANLPLFFIDMEPNSNIPNIVKLSELYYSKVKAEEPHKRTKIVQC